MTELSYHRCLLSLWCYRSLATEAAAGGKAQPQEEPVESKKKAFGLSNFFVRRIDPGHESHSSKLSDKDVIYELQSMFPSRILMLFAF